MSSFIFSEKIQKKKIKESSAANVISTLWVKSNKIVAMKNFIIPESCRYYHSVIGIWQTGRVPRQ